MEDSSNFTPFGLEGRFATILKCDVVNSSGLKEQLDLEGQFAFKRNFQQFVSELATRYHAHIEAFDGDAALVVFGVPQPREDSDEAAVCMGLELIRAIKNAGIVPGVTLELRVGIASGPIAVVKEPGGPSDKSIAGRPADVAERLRELAGSDQVLVADATKNLAGGIEYDDLGVLRVKGIKEGVRAWLAKRVLTGVSRFEGQHTDVSLGEIIGRAEELKLLSDAWMLAREGLGQAVRLIGDAGIGKSRLARAALEGAIREGATVLRIDCMPSTGNTPLYPIGVLLQRTAGIAQGTSEAEKTALLRRLLARYLPAEEATEALIYLAPVLGLKTPMMQADISPDSVRDRTISIVVGMMRNLAAEKPLAVLCEDLHWADDTTVKVLARACEELPRQSTLMIVTTRPVSEEPPLDLSKLTTIALEPLDPTSAAELVRSVAKNRALSEREVKRIVDRCEGVPLVLEEVARSALEMDPDDKSVAAEEAHGDVPAPLQLVVQSRLGRWPELAPIVRSAAVLGREFSLDALEGMPPHAAKSDVAATLDVLAREGLFAKPGSTRARFKHAMICEAVYNTLLRSERERLHSDAADLLGRNYNGTPDAAPDVIAEHLRKASRFVEAIQVRLAASYETAKRGAYVETRGHCAAALALIDGVKNEAERRRLKFQLLIQNGVALTGEYGYSAKPVEQAYREAQAICGDSAEAEMLYPIMRGLATIYLVRGDLSSAYDLSMQALKLAQQSARPNFHIDAMSVLCYTTLYFRGLKECRLWIGRCVDLYRTEQGENLSYPVPQDAATAAMAVLPTVAWLSGESQLAEEAVRDGLAHVERLNRDFDRALMHAWIGGARFAQRRYAEALDHAQTAVTISSRNGYGEWYATGALLSHMAKAAMSADPAALKTATEACMEFASKGVGLNASYYLWGLAHGYAKAGDEQTARAMLNQGLNQAKACQEERMNAELWIMQAKLEPDARLATELLCRALTLAEQQGDLATALRAATTLASLGQQPDKAMLEYAQTTFDFLEGRSPCPSERDWMQQRLSALSASPAVAAARGMSLRH